MRPAGIHPVGTVQSRIPAGRAEDPRRYSQRVSGNEGVTDSVKTENKSPSYSPVLSPQSWSVKRKILNTVGRFASAASQSEVPQGRYESSPGQAKRRPG